MKEKLKSECMLFGDVRELDTKLGFSFPKNYSLCRQLAYAMN